MKGCVLKNRIDIFTDFEFQEYGKVNIREVLLSASRINLDTLVIDIDTSSEIASALHSYRVVRPNTRVIILAEGRQPGDKTVAKIVAMGVTDIVTEPSELEAVLNSLPATYAQAARWVIQDELQEPKKKKVKEEEPKKEEKPKEEHKEVKKINLAESTATVSNTTGSALVVSYNLVKTGVYLILLVVLFAVVLFASGKIAGFFPVDNSLTQFLIKAADTIGSIF